MGWIKKNLIEYWIYPPLLSSLQSYSKLQEKNIIDEKHTCWGKQNTGAISTYANDAWPWLISTYANDAWPWLISTYANDA